MTPEERREIWSRCERAWDRHPRVGPARRLRELAGACDPEAEGDHYGQGGLVAELEARVAKLLGKEAAVLMPSGTMAQQIALRLHAEDRGTRRVAFHPTSHLELHEQGAYRHLHGLQAQLVGTRTGPLVAGQLTGLAERPGAVLVELPQRELGGLLPSWDELEALRTWADQEGVALHLDGARLWESCPFYAASPAEVSALFESVYVSFYKTLGAVSGAALAGDARLIQRARVWQRRHGGNVVAMWPVAASALRALDTRLERVPEYCEAARGVAAALGSLPGVRVRPDPPHTNMFHVFLPGEPEALLDASAQVAAERGVALVRHLAPADVPGYCVHEFVAGDATLELDPGELAGMLRKLLEYAGEG